MNDQSLKYYEKPTIIILMLCLIFPVGLYFMWKSEIWSKKTRWIITIIISLFLILGQTSTSPPGRMNMSSLSPSFLSMKTYRSLDNGGVQINFLYDKDYTINGMINDKGVYIINNNYIYPGKRSGGNYTLHFPLDSTGQKINSKILFFDDFGVELRLVED